MHDKRVLLPLLLLAFLCGCTQARTVVFSRPSVMDHKHFPCNTVESSRQGKPVFVRDLERGLPPLANPLTPGADAPDLEHLDAFLEQNGTTAFMVVKNDTILYEKYFNGLEANEPSIVFSVNKAFLTTLVAMAMQDGKIRSLDQKVREFLPEFTGDGRDGISLRNLLLMNSGLDFGEYESGVVKLGRFYYNNNLPRYLNKLKVAHTPGTYFAYKSVDSQLLTICLQKAVGTDIPTYLKEKIWEPLGMAHPVLLTMDSKKNQTSRMFGGMAICSPDLLRFGKLLMNNGKWEGRQLFSPDWLEAIRKRVLDTPGQWYGYNNGYWLDNRTDRSLAEQNDFTAAGFNGQYLYMNPENGVMILRQGKNKGKVDWQYLIGSMCQNLSGCKSPDYSHLFAGRYKNQQGDTIAIYRNPEGGWEMKVPGAKKPYPLVHYGPHSLYYKKGYTRAIFDIENEQAKGLYLDDFQKLTYCEKVEE